MPSDANMSAISPSSRSRRRTNSTKTRIVVTRSRVCVAKESACVRVTGSAIEK
jgi:hypothetical protein